MILRGPSSARYESPLGLRASGLGFRLQKWKFGNPNSQNQDPVTYNRDLILGVRVAKNNFSQIWLASLEFSGLLLSLYELQSEFPWWGYIGIIRGTIIGSGY